MAAGCKFYMYMYTLLLCNKQGNLTSLLWYALRESTKEFRSLMKKKRDLEKHVMEMDGMIAPRGTTIG